MKTTKRTLLCIILSWFMIFGGTVTPVISMQAETTVLVTRTGSRYHTRKCGNGTYYESTLSAARARGLTPCQKCYSGGYTVSSSAGSSSNHASYSTSSGSTSSNRPAPTPKPISLSTNAIELVKGQTKKLSVKNASGTMKWTSSDPSIATVSNGIVKAKAKGKATITVSANGQTKNCKVKVEDPQLSKDKLSLKIDSRKQLKIVGCSHNVTWKTSDDDVADVNEDGYVDAYAPGTATITGTVHGKKYKCKVTVALPEINEIEILNIAETVAVNTNFTLEVTTDDDDIFNYENVKAESSDDSIVSVLLTDEGTIELESFRKTGTATITISIGGLEKSCDITVIDSINTMEA